MTSPSLRSVANTITLEPNHLPNPLKKYYSETIFTVCLAQNNLLDKIATDG